MKFNPDSSVITPAQYKYIESLMIDLELWDRRHAYYQEYLDTPHLENATKYKASSFISRLREWKGLE